MRREEVAKAENAVAEFRLEVAEIGRRIEEARQQELASRERLSDLSADAAAMTRKLAEGETTLQELRETRAKLEQQVADHRQQVSQLSERRQQLVKRVEDLAQREQTATRTFEHARGRANELQSDLIALNEALASRNVELAAVDGNIQRARNTLAELQERIAEARRSLVRPEPIPESKSHQDSAGDAGAQEQSGAPAPSPGSGTSGQRQ
jgi:chromosome segregation ATPase